MGFCIEDYNDGHGIVLKYKNGSVVLYTETVKSMDFIKEELPFQLSNAVVPTSFVSLLTHDSSMPTYHSFMPTSGPTYTFEHWHAALGHVSAAALRHTNIFEDGHLIPPAPKKFHCQPYILAKSKHTVPGPSECKTTAPFQLIHSDIRGRFPVKSIDGYEYYLILIDDYSRASWICFLQHKSDAPKAVKDFCLMLKR